MEIKAWIRGWEGVYQITTSGIVYSWKSGEPVQVKSSLLRKGHHSVLLKSEDGKKKKRQYVHRLVWETFKREKLRSKEWIIHKDGNLDNNRLTNLEKKEVNKGQKVFNNRERGSNEEIRYYVEDEQGNKTPYTTLAEIVRDYGINYRRAKKTVASGEWIEINQKKNL